METDTVFIVMAGNSKFMLDVQYTKPRYTPISSDMPQYAPICYLFCLFVCFCLVLFFVFFGVVVVVVLVFFSFYFFFF